MGRPAMGVPKTPAVHNAVNEPASSESTPTNLNQNRRNPQLGNPPCRLHNAPRPDDLQSAVSPGHNPARGLLWLSASGSNHNGTPPIPARVARALHFPQYKARRQGPPFEGFPDGGATHKSWQIRFRLPGNRRGQSENRRPDPPQGIFFSPGYRPGNLTGRAVSARSASGTGLSGHLPTAWQLSPQGTGKRRRERRSSCPGPTCRLSPNPRSPLPGHPGRW